VVTIPTHDLERRWEPAALRPRPLRLLIGWLVSAGSLYGAAGLLPGVALEAPGGAFLVAALIAVVNAILPPVLAAVRLPFTLLSGCCSPPMRWR
jgi:hypothetical protein